MLTGEIGGSHKEEVFCILCWLMVASHTECFGESTLCIRVLFHFEGGGVKIPSVSSPGPQKVFRVNF